MLFAAVVAWATAAAAFWSADWEVEVVVAEAVCHGGVGAVAAVELEAVVPVDVPGTGTPSRALYQLTSREGSNEIVTLGTFCRVQVSSVRGRGKPRINL